MVRRVYIPVLACLAGAALIALLIYGVSTQSASRTLDEAVAHGERPPAPDATHLLPALAGSGKRSLASYKGQIVLLNFWASWCEPCKEEAPQLQSTERELQRHNGTVLGVTYLDATPDSRAFVHSYHLTYPNLRDVDGEFAHSYGTDQLPESFLIDRDGHIARISRGEVNKEFLQAAVELARSS